MVRQLHRYFNVYVRNSDTWRLRPKPRNVLMATASIHARKFALAMHNRVSRGLNTDLMSIGRVVMEIDRVGHR
jgi:hypothetical protein